MAWGVVVVWVFVLFCLCCIFSYEVLNQDVETYTVGRWVKNKKMVAKGL